MVPTISLFAVFPWQWMLKTLVPLHQAQAKTEEQTHIQKITQDKYWARNYFVSNLSSYSDPDLKFDYNQ